MHIYSIYIGSFLLTTSLQTSVPIAECVHHCTLMSKLENTSSQWCVLARWLPSNWSVITVIIIVCTRSLLRNITSCGGSHRVPRSRGKNIPNPLPARSAHYPPHHLALRHRVETTMIQGQRWCLMFKVLSPFVFPEKINGGGWWWGTGEKSC